MKLKRKNIVIQWRAINLKVTNAIHLQVLTLLKQCNPLPHSHQRKGTLMSGKY